MIALMNPDFRSCPCLRHAEKSEVEHGFRDLDLSSLMPEVGEAAGLSVRSSRALFAVAGPNEPSRNGRLVLDGTSRASHATSSPLAGSATFRRASIRPIAA